MSRPLGSAAHKDERLNLRISADEKATLERASRSLRMTTSEFVLREAMAAADVILAERNRFVLSDEQWTAFTQRLDEPPRAIPALAELLDKPSPFAVTPPEETSSEATRAAE
jgi:uncharacterized protein (DUF1778 family)